MFSSYLCVGALVMLGVASLSGLGAVVTIVTRELHRDGCYAAVGFIWVTFVSVLALFLSVVLQHLGY